MPGDEELLATVPAGNPIAVCYNYWDAGQGAYERDVNWFPGTDVSGVDLALYEGRQPVGYLEQNGEWVVQP
jgi:hypothetical protein